MDKQNLYANRNILNCLKMYLYICTENSKQSHLICFFLQIPIRLLLTHELTWIGIGSDCLTILFNIHVVLMANYFFTKFHFF